MMPDELYSALSGIRDEYRTAMNRASEHAQIAAQEEDMEKVSEFSTESARKGEAFTAMNRAVAAVEKFFQPLTRGDRGADR